MIFMTWTYLNTRVSPFAMKKYLIYFITSKRKNMLMTRINTYTDKKGLIIWIIQ